jgi:hypothetical protein
VDPRGAAAALSATPLGRLAERTGESLPALTLARARTAERLGAARTTLGGVAVDRDVTVALMGSWGRRELTSGSDEDWLVVHRRAAGTVVRPDVGGLARALQPPAGEQGIFNRAVAVEELVRFGLTADDNTNMTQRLLFLLESVPLLGERAHREAQRAILAAYLEGERRDRRPPRFLLNDVVRYWRTICVDFEGKARQGSRKWALRHAKLRTSRTVLFAGGLLPILACHHVVADEVEGVLLDAFAEPPTDRLARAFLEHDAADAGARTLAAYDRFLALVDDPEKRARLEALERDEAPRDPVFAEARRLGREVQQGLQALLFEREPLRRLARQYLVF